mgnify:CR=1 FL=1
MPPSNTQSNQSFHDAVSRIKPSAPFVIMIIGALAAFEIFNYTTTDHALTDLLGSLSFAGIQWSTILALAFCGIDFAGIARLFTPEQGLNEPKEVWYLFGAWLLAATMNAILTWWGVSMAVVNHPIQSSSVIDPQTIANVVPVFVAVMVWVIRILIIGTLALAMDRLVHPDADRQRITIQNANAAAISAQRSQHLTARSSQPVSSIPAALNSAAIPQRPSMTRAASSQRVNRNSISPDYEEPEPQQSSVRVRPEPTYHSLSMSARPSINRTGSVSRDLGGASRLRRS